MTWYFPWEWDILDWLGWAIVLGGLASFWIYDKRKSRQSQSSQSQRNKP